MPTPQPSDTGRGNRADHTIALASMASPLGALWLACDTNGRAVTIDWDDAALVLQRLRKRGFLDVSRDPAGVAPLRAWLDAYFAGKQTPPMATNLTGMTPFQARVLRELERLPTGRQTTYGGLAASIGAAAGSARAIGGAVGSNPLPILIACHRVLQSDGSLGGFSGGLDRKRWLLRHEGLAWKETRTQAVRGGVTSGPADSSPFGAAAG